MNVAGVGLILGIFFVVYTFHRGEDFGFGLTMSALLVGPSVALLVEQWKDILFRRWILEHWDEIAAGTAVLHGRVVDAETTLVCYPLVASAMFLHMHASGRPTLPGTRTASLARWSSVAIAAVGGWWFFPAGPLATLLTLAIGFRDRPKQVTLGEVAMATYLNRTLAPVTIDG